MMRKRIRVVILQRPNRFRFISLNDNENNQQPKIKADKKHLVNFFEKELKLCEQDIQCKTVESREDINEEFKKLKEDAERYDFFIIAILAKLAKNASNQLVFNDSKQEPISLEDIFENMKNTAFNVKPKLVLVQADDTKQMPAKGEFKGDQMVRVEEKKIPSDADRLVIMSTIPQELAQPSIIRNIQQHYLSLDEAVPGCIDETDVVPSFLIQSFTKILTDYRESGTDLFCLTPCINKSVREKIDALLKERELVIIEGIDESFNRATKVIETLQVPLISSTLTKDVFLF